MCLVWIYVILFNQNIIKFVIDITSLDEIVEYLRSKHFAKSQWHILGLQLGLYKHTLDDIDTENRGNLARCLSECLAAWLRQEDKVSEKGRPTWKSLASALTAIEDYC